MKVKRRKPRTAKVGVFGVGHYAYWPQFEGLLEEMHQKLNKFIDKVKNQGVDVIDFGLIDDAKGAYRLVSELKTADLDLIFCDMVTYATSSTFGKIIREIDTPIDFNEGFVLVGHDGPHHKNIADKKPVLRSLTKYHGKPGAGASVEFKIKEGPITILSIGLTVEGKPKFVLAEGESVQGPIPPTGNTNTRGYFEPDIKTFLKSWVAEGPTHHFALGVGHHAQSIRKIANILNIESVITTNE